MEVQSETHRSFRLKTSVCFVIRAQTLLHQRSSSSSGALAPTAAASRHRAHAASVAERDPPHRGLRADGRSEATEAWRCSDIGGATDTHTERPQSARGAEQLVVYGVFNYRSCDTAERAAASGQSSFQVT